MDNFARLVSRLLYLVDPADMGRTVSAPLDEYDSEANRLASAVRGAESAGAVMRVVEAEYPGAAPVLADSVAAAYLLLRQDPPRTFDTGD